MRSHLTKCLVAALIMASSARANLIDVTRASQVSLENNDRLIFTLSADCAACRSSNYPSEIQFLLGAMPLGGPVESIPGTSGVYLTGQLFSAAIVSADGSLTIPLVDPNAARLGLPSGDVLLQPGSHSGGSYSGPVDVISADAVLSSQEAAQLFSAGSFQVTITDIGAPITFGYPGATMAGDFSASLTGANGSQSEGARLLDAELEPQCRRSNTPEPGTIGLLIIGLTVFTRRAIRR